MMDTIKEELTQHLLEGLKTDKVSKHKDLKKYIGTNYDFTGLSVPQQRAIFKKGFSFNELSARRQLEIWNHIWQTSNHYEMMTFAQMFVSRHSKELLTFEPAVLWDAVKGWVKRIDNWAHSDDLSAIYARLLEQEPDLIYNQYDLWNTSSNPWERRQSIVGILYYSSARKKLVSFEKIVSLLTPLLNDENYFVQKGVGWTLREMGNVYPAETLALMNEHIASIKPVAFTAAVEKLAMADKEQFKKLRRRCRLNEGTM